MNDFPDFYKWCEKRNLNPFLEDEAEGSKDQEVKSEANATKRAAVRSHAYPPLYGRGQYPPEYFRPIAADAAVYQDIEGEKGRTK